MFPPGIEPGTICVLGRCDNHYTTETSDQLIFRTVTSFLDSPFLIYRVRQKTVTNLSLVYLNLSFDEKTQKLTK